MPKAASVLAEKEKPKELQEESKVSETLQAPANGPKPFASSRLTKVVCINKKSEKVFEWPSVQNQAKCMADGVYLRGVMNNKQDGTYAAFNFVMSNGDTSN